MKIKKKKKSLTLMEVFDLERKHTATIGSPAHMQRIVDEWVKKNRKKK